jgi:two-component system phosphate regulon response regulator PhoB/two-component system alkaline phosphatase synthesis response regulator PhoP
MVKIAIIEDEAAIAEMYKIKLQQAGYEVGVAENGRLGLELCEKLKPDLVLLDIMMPEMSGPEMLAKMKATEWGKKPLVMLLTNLSQHESEIDPQKFPVEGYAVKAYYTPGQLLDKINELLIEHGKLPKQ